MSYSRNIVLSLRNCRKFGNELNGIRHASSPWSKCVWKDLKLLNLLVPTRGKRCGKQHISTVVKRIPVLPPFTRCDRPRNHLLSETYYPESEKSRDSYKSVSIQLQQRMSFTLSRSTNVLTASEFPYLFCSYLFGRTKTKRCCNKWTVDQCIFQRANFGICSFNSQIFQILRWTTKVKRAASNKTAISFAGLISFTGFSVQMM